MKDNAIFEQMLIKIYDFFSFVQSKKKFERECKEAEKSQVSFERLDNDINATKSDVEKVRASFSSTPAVNLLSSASPFYYLQQLQHVQILYNSKNELSANKGK